MPEKQVLEIARETVTTFTALGIRFMDAVSNRPVTGGLAVSARPELSGRPEIRAFPTASSLYAFQGLPGLRALEYADAGFDPATSDKTRFLVRVDDRLARFLPSVFTVDLPLDYPGPFLSEPAGSLPSDIAGHAGFYLFPAPRRARQPGIAVVRSRLTTFPGERPAAHAVLEATVAGATWRGIADRRGCVALHFPYPLFRLGTPGGSSPSAGPVTAWQMTFRVHHEPHTLSFPLGEQAPPLLASIFGQSGADVWTDSPDTASAAAEPQGVADLAYGAELVLRTEGRSDLLIDVPT